MKKFKHIWIFSDSIAGHEIQSKALASKLGDNIVLLHCTIRQPWLSFAPRILPRFGKNIIWEKQQPDINQQPNLIITCGRRMAAIGKYHKRQLNCKHIQILNPGDNPEKYDILVCPQHDGIKGNNVIASQGSLHTISVESLAKTNCTDPTDIVAVFLGNPGKYFFKTLDQLIQNISAHCPKQKVVVCGSRRTPQKYHDKIRTIFKESKSIWLSENDGENPYMELLACSQVLVVSADSINMVSEACASNKPVIAIGQEYISPKHQRFIRSIEQRLSSFEDIKIENEPLRTLDITAKQIQEMMR